MSNLDFLSIFSDNNSLSDNDFDQSVYCLIYSIVTQTSKPPYYCSCTKSTFSNRQKIQRHIKAHNILIPFKNIKRKSDELAIDCTVKQCKRYIKSCIPLYIL